MQIYVMPKDCAYLALFLGRGVSTIIYLHYTCFAQMCVRQIKCNCTIEGDAPNTQSFQSADGVWGSFPPSFMDSA